MDTPPATDLFRLMGLEATVDRCLEAVFHEMAGLPLEPLPNGRTEAPPNGPELKATLALEGEARGRLLLRGPAALAGQLALRVHGEGLEEAPPSLAMDAWGELLNMVAGNLKSDLNNCGMECHLHPPETRPAGPDAPHAWSDAFLIKTFRSSEHVFQIAVWLEEDRTAAEAP